MTCPFHHCEYIASEETVDWLFGATRDWDNPPSREKIIEDLKDPCNHINYLYPHVFKTCNTMVSRPPWLPRSSRVKIEYGNGATEYGPGINIHLTGAEVATAIDAWLVAHGIHVSGPRTVTVNGELCGIGKVYVDPSGFVIADGKRFSGRGESDV